MTVEEASSSLSSPVFISWGFFTVRWHKQMLNRNTVWRDHSISASAPLFFKAKVFKCGVDRIERSIATQKEFFFSLLSAMAHMFFQQWVTSEVQRASLGCRGAAGASAQDTHTDLWVSGTVQVCALRGNWSPARTVSVLGQREVIIPLTLSIVWRCVGGVTPSLWGRCPPVLGQSRCCAATAAMLRAESSAVQIARSCPEIWLLMSKCTSPASRQCRGGRSTIPLCRSWL